MEDFLLTSSITILSGSVNGTEYCADISVIDDNSIEDEENATILLTAVNVNDAIFPSLFLIFIQEQEGKIRIVTGAYPGLREGGARRDRRHSMQTR